MDKRWQQLGELLVDYSAAVKARRACHDRHGRGGVAAARAGGLRGVQFAPARCPQVQFLSETLRHALLQFGSDEQLRWVPEIEAYGMEWADVYFGLRGAYNLHMHAGIPAERLSANQGALGKVSTLRWQKTRWCLVRVPNEAFAIQAETDLETVMDMFFAACLLDWPAESARWQRWAEALNGATQRAARGQGDGFTLFGGGANLDGRRRQAQHA